MHIGRQWILNYNVFDIMFTSTASYPPMYHWFKTLLFDHVLLANSMINDKFAHDFIRYMKMMHAISKYGGNKKPISLA